MEHNRYTKASVLALLIGSVLSVAVVGGLLYKGVGEFGSLMYFVLLSILSMFFNLFLAYKIQKGHFVYVRYALWIYLIQILSFESSQFGFSLIVGFRFFITWSIDDCDLIR